MLEEIINAAERLKGVAIHTPLTEHPVLSSFFKCNLRLKREDLQPVRSYKLRGAYNLISMLSSSQRKKGVICASAGNHAQGVAYSCSKLGVKGTIFMPNTTPKQKINQVKFFGHSNITIKLEGDTFDDAYHAALLYATSNGQEFVHPFDDERIIAGQGTVGKEIIEDMAEELDYVVMPIGGGGLISGVASYIKKVSPNTKIIGVEPQGAASMTEAIKKNKAITLGTIDPFVDGAAVKKVGEINYAIAKNLIDDIIVVPEGRVCTWILKLYSEQGIVVEPAGVLSIAALEYLDEKIKNKNVVSIVSGSNNDIDRMQEIKERSLLFEGLKHYLIITFPQRAGALKEFVNEVLGPNDDITRFEFTKQNSKESGPALVGIEVKNPQDFEKLVARLETKKINYRMLNRDKYLFEYFL